MSTITKKGQVTIPKPFKSLLDLGGIAKGRKVGIGDEREFTKKVVAKRVAKEGLKDG